MEANIVGTRHSLRPIINNSNLSECSEDILSTLENTINAPQAVPKNPIKNVPTPKVVIKSILCLKEAFE